MDEGETLGENQKGRAIANVHFSFQEQNPSVSMRNAVWQGGRTDVSACEGYGKRTANVMRGLVEHSAPAITYLQQRCQFLDLHISSL